MSGPGRRRRWWRWTLAGAALLVVIVVGGAATFVKSQPSAAPLTLPSGPARPPTGPADGTWAVTTGSVAGFRIRESALGLGNDVTGRTTALTGTAAIAGGQVTSAAFRIGLAAITVGGKPSPQFAASLGVAAHPAATITISARRDGAAVEAAGSIPVSSARWDITLPAGFGFLGGLSSEATAEFLLILHRGE